MYSSGIYNFKVALGSLMNSDLKLQNYVKIEYGNGKLNDTALGNRNWEEKVTMWAMQLNTVLLNQWFGARPSG